MSGWSQGRAPVFVALLAAFAVGCDDGDGGGGDAGDPPVDAMTDGAGGGAADMAPDAIADAMPDVIVDAVPDAIVDAAPDAIVDAMPDAIADAMPDAIADAAVDAEADAVVDAEVDQGPPPCDGDGDCAEGEVCGAGGFCEPAPPCEADGDCAELEVCGAGGFCVPEPPCAGDAECEAGEVCAEIGFCRPAPPCLVDFDCAEARLCEAGLCRGAPACDGLEPCIGDRPCVDGLCAQQTCADDDACGEGSLCLEGRCRVADCRDAFDCAPGLRCLRNLCIAGDCIDDGDCGESRLCFDNRCGPGDCRVDEQCEAGALCLENLCTAADCRDDVDCGAGALCIVNACVAGDCREDVDCGDGGLCEANTCVPGDCRGDGDCGDGSLCLDAFCAVADCRGDAECAVGQLCLGNVCTVADCRGDGECAESESCVRNTCIVGDCLDGLDCADGQTCIRNFCIDGDCVEDFDCGGGQLCLDQTCTVADCRLDGDCAAGSLCFDNQCTVADCRETADCGEGQTCIRNDCVDGDCLLDGDCGEGELCLDQMCTVADCRIDVDCVEGETCIRNTCVLGDCIEDFDCDEGVLCLGNTCTPNGCRGDDDCEFGSLCFDQLCEEAECREDAQCRAGQLCLERSCISGDCRADDECGDDELCLDNNCTVANCRLAADCVDGENCVRNTCVDGDCLDDGDCGAGSLCLENTCTPANCRVDDECADDQLCLENFCTRANCRADAECADGELCLANLCAPGNCRTVDDCADGELCTENFCVPDPALASCRAALDYPADGVLRGDLRGLDAVQQGTCGGAGPERVYVRTQGPTVQCLRLVDADGPITLHARATCGDTETEAACADAPPPGTGLTLNAAPGTVWFIYVDSPEGQAGRFTLNTVAGACPATCEGDVECAAGQLCLDRLCRPAPNCADDAACPEGRICEGGRCAPPQCADDPDCEAGELCLDLRCTAADCREDADCAEGLCFENTCQLDRCREDADCAVGLCFDTQCVADGCREDGDCEEGLCFENRCQLDRCRADADCAVGLCFDTQCVADGCRDHPDCDEGLCFENRCQLDRCRDDADCAVGLCFDTRCVADGCRDDGDCEVGLCLANRCEPNGCRADADCAEGLCLAERCEPDGCRADADCAEGICVAERCRDGCRLDEQCPEGALCLDLQCVEGGCRGDDDCGADQLCFDGLCARADCRADAECVDGICEENLCVAGQCDVGELVCPEGQVCFDNRCLDFVQTFGTCDLPWQLPLGRRLNHSLAEAPAEVAQSCGGQGQESVYRFVAPAAGAYCFLIEQAGFDPLIAVRATCADGESEIACAENSERRGPLPEVTVTLDPEGLEGPAEVSVFVDWTFPFFEVLDYTILARPGACGEAQPCELDADCAVEGEVCYEGTCQDIECRNNDECGGERPICRNTRCIPDVPISTCEAPFEVLADETVRGSTEFADSTHVSGCVQGDSPEHVHLFVPERTSEYCATTIGSNFDTVLYARATCGEAETQLACNDDFEDVQSAITFGAEAGTPVFIFVDGFGDGSFGDYQLDVRRGRCGEPPPCDFDADCAEGELCFEALCVPDPCANAIPLDEPGNYAANNTGQLALHSATCAPTEGPERIFTFTRAEPGPVCLDTLTATFDTVLSVRAGLCDDAVSEVRCNDDDGSSNGRQSRLTLDAEADVPYYVFVDGREGAVGNFTLGYSEGPCDFSDGACYADADCPEGALCIAKQCVEGADLGGCAEPMVIEGFGEYAGNTRQNGQAVYGAGCGGGAASVEDVYVFQPEAAGRVCFNLDGALHDTVLHVRAGSCTSGSAQVACNDDAPGIAAGVASALDIDVAAGETYYVFVDGFGFARGAYTLAVTAGPCRPPCVENADCGLGESCVDGGCAVACAEDADCREGERCAAGGCEAAPVYGSCEAPIPITTAVGQYTADTVGAPAIFEPECVAAPSGSEAVFRLTPEADAELCLTTEGTAFDAVLSVYDAPCGEGQSLTCADDNDIDLTSVFDSAVSLNARADQTYFVVLDSVGGGGGEAVLNVREGRCRTPAFCELRDDLIIYQGGSRGSLQIDNTGLPNAYTGNCGASRGPEAIVAFDIDQPSRVDIEVVARNYDTMFYITQPCDGPIVECDDDGGAGLSSRITRNMDPGTYYLMVEGYSGGVGTSTIEFRIDPL